mmetsp:Transcript_21030/g.43671  ORF Transcript_21030/g.43671 Transcript_21030/m.43671 type:complete len:100 (+) Transcript_21030:451-750(+)
MATRAGKLHNRVLLKQSNRQADVHIMMIFHLHQRNLVSTQYIRLGHSNRALPRRFQHDVMAACQSLDAACRRGASSADWTGRTRGQDTTLHSSMEVLCW